MFPGSVSRIFKIGETVSVMEPIFSQVAGFLYSTALSRPLSRSLVVLKSSSYRNFEKSSFYWTGVA